MDTGLTSPLAGLTRERIGDLAATLGRRVRDTTPASAGDPADFIQEAVRKVLAGERALRGDLTLDENLVSIAQSLVWNERKKAAVRGAAEGERARAAEDGLDADTLWNLHAALEKVRRRFEAMPGRGRADSDAFAFVGALTERLDRRASIRPGEVTRALGWRRDRAYAAWRRVKDLVRAEMQEMDP